MREILFRAKRTANNEWVEGFYFETPIGEAFIMTSKQETKTVFKVIPETLGQFTGLYDSTKWENLTKREQQEWLRKHTADEWKGRRIFEGDIVTGYFNHEKVTGYIFYGSDASFFIQRKGLYGIGLNNAELWLEVIGNIHDNSETLME